MTNLSDPTCGSLDGVWVALSGSIPHPDERKVRIEGWDELGFRIFVFNLVSDILLAGGGIAYGSHPSFQAFVEEAASQYKSVDPKRVRMFLIPSFVSDVWREVRELIARHETYAEVSLIGGIDASRQACLNELAERLSNDVQAIVCCGGRAVGKSLNQTNPQVEAEIRKAIERDCAVYLIGGCGGVSRELFEKQYVTNAAALRNGLSGEDNHSLYASANPWEAVRLVMKGLKELRNALR